MRSRYLGYYNMRYLSSRQSMYDGMEYDAIHIHRCWSHIFYDRQEDCGLFRVSASLFLTPGAMGCLNGVRLKTIVSLFCQPSSVDISLSICKEVEGVVGKSKGNHGQYPQSFRGASFLK